MPKCPHCRAEISEESRFCASCGASLSLDADQPTRLSAPTQDQSITSAGASRVATPGGGTSTQAAFPPGTLLADRYRIVGILGKGGMGEVYRADDLKLDQAVALKFLSPKLEGNPDRLRRFLAEVRAAREVSHPNVCRVHDIGQVEGRHFISMEFVDGEDLAALLRRVKRLPQERAVEVAREICAGLAAVHEQGLIHRDLKPANVMLDGRGRVRLTDFGLASRGELLDDKDLSSGTPAYMSPEQIRGLEVSQRSDIYALGLVLYEILTGRPAYLAETLGELRDLQESRDPESPSLHVENIDEAFERTLMLCLEREPSQRPTSALAVSAALPGGDPIAAALALGMTPSPEAVAEAGGQEGLRLGPALAILATLVTIIVAGSYWAGSMSRFAFLPLDKQPEVFIDRAKGIIAELGFHEEIYSKPHDTAWGYNYWDGIIAETLEEASQPSPWEDLRGRYDAASFWFRQSPRTFEPTAEGVPLHLRRSVRLTNPLPVVAGEVVVILDLAGRLRRFQTLPRRYAMELPSEPDWAPLFELADLDISRFQEVEPRYQRYYAPDLRRAWLGTREDRPEELLRIEAGAFEGRPALFNVATQSGMEDLGSYPEPFTQTWVDRFNNTFQPLLILAVVLTGTLFAYQNLRRGRTDQRGAMRFAFVLAGSIFVTTWLGSHMMWRSDTWTEEMWILIPAANFMGLVGWALYSATEPLGRQVAPKMFVSSSRLLSRAHVRWRDPILGQAVLVGLAAGMLEAIVNGPVRRLLMPLWTDGPVFPLWSNPYYLKGGRYALSTLTNQAMSMTMALVLVVVLIIFTKRIRIRWLALSLTVLVWTLLEVPGSLESVGFEALFSSILLFVLLRWGVLAFLVSQITVSFCYTARFSDLTAWHDQAARLALAALIALAVYGAWASMGSQKRRGA